METPDGQRLICHPRGKKSQAVVGDRVLWQASQDEGTIEKVEERRNLFYRQDEIRTKSFAANLDQVLILIAAEPEFSESQLARALIAAEAERITPLIALNKSDLASRSSAPGAACALPAHGLRRAAAGAQPRLRRTSRPTAARCSSTCEGKTTLVLGPSGAGKSTLINLLVPGAQALTGEISQALNSGKHTTTSTTLVLGRCGERTTALIDSPGFQEFGLHHIDAMHLAALHAGPQAACVANCKFYNCTHLHEPGCGVIAAVKSAGSPDGVSARRYKIYSELFAELSQSKY